MEYWYFRLQARIGKSGMACLFSLAVLVCIGIAIAFIQYIFDAGMLDEACLGSLLVLGFMMCAGAVIQILPDDPRKAKEDEQS